jgi:hypothetical protein
VKARTALSKALSCTSAHSPSPVFGIPDRSVLPGRAQVATYAEGSDTATLQAIHGGGGPHLSSAI